MGLTFWQDFLFLPHVGNSFNIPNQSCRVMGWDLNLREKGTLSWPCCKAAEGTKPPKNVSLGGVFGHQPQSPGV